jgi:misacylated tRNA(Ala) deacylase
MTHLLYHTDAYLQTFEAQVSAHDSEQHALILDCTAFYAGGGGQPHDTGTLTFDGQPYRVDKIGRGYAHIISGELPPIGSVVQGQIDWARRYHLMRTHTAMHILCGVVWRDYQASVTGGNMEPLEGRMDFEFEKLQKELVAEIEAKINAEVAAARDIRVQILPRAQALAIPDLIRTKTNLLPEAITEIRTVEIVGLDLQADGGTHVANTREVGHLTITEFKNKGGINKRIYLKLGD